MGYTILRRLNGGEAPAKLGTRVGGQLHGLTDGRLGLRIGGAASQGHDEKAVEVGKTSATNGQVGLNGSEHYHGSSREENGNRAPVEWEEK